MPEHGKLPEQRLSALYRYINALEQGDIETLAEMLNEAGRDPVLSALLEEVDAVYQAIDGTAVSEREARRALHSVLAPEQNGHLARDQQTKLLQAIQNESKETLMKEQATLPLPRIQNHHQSPTRQRGRGLQLLAALLVVCMLIGAAALIINTHMQVGQSGHVPTTTPASTKPPRGVVVAMAGGDIESTSNQIYGLRPDNGKRLWTFTVPKVREGQSSGRNLIVQGQNVYALINSQVYALRATDGKWLWHTNLFNASSPQEYYTLLSDDNLLYIGAGTEGNLPFVDRLFALRPMDGSIIWHHTYQSGDATLLNAHKGIVYLATGFNNVNSNQLRALRGSDGKQIWAYPGGQELSAVADNTSVYLFAMGNTDQQDPNGMHKDEKVIIALNTQNGKPRWTTPVSSNGIDQIQIDQNRLFLNEYHNNNQQICSWRVENGHQVWCHSFMANPMSGGTSYLVTNGTLYAFSTPTTVVGTVTAIVQGTVVSRPLEHQETIVQAYNASDGQTKQWSTTLNDWSTGNAVLGDKQLFVATEKHVWALDQSGNVVWSYQNPSQSQSSSVDAFSKGFYIVTEGSW